MKRLLPFLFLVFFIPLPGFGDENVDILNNVICGPRCVQQVLGHFGIEAELVELVREMQWPKLTEGASAESIVQALEKRGIYVKAVQVDFQTSVLSWKHPVILHLKPESNGSLGHFVVWRPESTDQHLVLFDGLSGYRMESRKKLAGKMSGIALLPSRTPVSDDVSAVYRTFALWPWGLGGTVLIAGFLFVKRWSGRVKGFQED